jgi:HlyD family secretion protein
LNQAKAGYESSLAAKTTAGGQSGKGRGGFQTQQGIVRPQTAFGIGFHRLQGRPRRRQAQVESADDQVNVAKASVDNAQDLLDKTTIVSPLDGTITTLNSQLGERVLGTVQNAGTDIMIISD